MSATAVVGNRASSGRVISPAAVAGLFAVLVYVADVLLLFSNEPYYSDAEPGAPVQALDDFALLLVVALGFFILRLQPRNKVGWWIMVGGLSFLLAAFASQLAEYGVRSWGQTEVTLYSGWVARWIWLGSQVAIPFILLYYPNGRLPTRRWGPVLAYFWLVVGIALLTYAFTARPVYPQWVGESLAHEVPNPLVVEALSSAFEHPLAHIFVQASMVSLNVLGGIALIFRYRTAAAVERLQIKAVGLVAAMSVLGLVGLQLLEVDATTTVLLNIGITLLTVGTIGAAIARYRLFDIDRLISRTISYSVVVVVLVGVYFGLVTAVTSFLPTQGSLAVAGTTLTVAAMFNPVRKRVQQWVDRRFNRSRYDAENVLGSFLGQLQVHVDVDVLSNDLVDAVVEALGPRFATVWVARR